MAIQDIQHELEHHPRPCDKEGLKKSIRDALIHYAGKDPLHATHRDWLEAVSYAVRERMIERRMYTQRLFDKAHAKRVYYLSMEYLIGRMLINSLMNLGFFEATREALS
ncbi:MAG TPA: glycogen phosphorylase, partial [Thioalkalivibrio sp.]|nr:glycogen phosphorylase [Thioalkalivibrio sp.]